MLDETKINDKTNNIENIILAFSLLFIDKENIKGLILKGKNSPLKDELLKRTKLLFKKNHFLKINPFVDDTALSGGMDFIKTLKKGKKISNLGLLDKKNTIFHLSMAEKINSNLAGRYYTAFEKNNTLAFILTDESSSQDENIHSGFIDRLSFNLNLENIHYTEMKKIKFDKKKLKLARKKISSIKYDKNIYRAISEVCFSFKISSMRAHFLTFYSARAIAAYEGHDKIELKDLEKAVFFCLSHKAISIPERKENEENDNKKSQSEGLQNTNENSNENENEIPLEILLDSVMSGISPEIFKFLKMKSRKNFEHSSNSGSGQKKINKNNGSPLPSKKGKYKDTKSIDFFSTLISAVPWQKIREKNPVKKNKNKIIITKDDIRIKQKEDKNQRVIIFVVDASGTLALGRLAETKGAIEILLSEAYSKRDLVSLIAFRGKKAEILLPPTKSLVQTKKKLASLPGGGTTPLASALFSILELTKKVKSKGLFPTFILLTDGKGNISLDGEVDKEKSKVETKKLCELLIFEKIPSILIDTSIRPKKESKELSELLSSTYIFLPKANSHSLSKIISKELG